MPDALSARMCEELYRWCTWLAGPGASGGCQGGYVGEFGYSATLDAASWAAVEREWYKIADANLLWTTAWSAGEYPSGRPNFQFYYQSVADGRAVDTSDGVASGEHELHYALTGHPEVKRGVGTSTGSINTNTTATISATPNATFNNHLPGVYGTDYVYDSRATFDYYYARGASLVRIAFRMERLIPTPGAAFDASEQARLVATVQAAVAAGLAVVLDCHNYGGYYLWNGSTGNRQRVGIDSGFSQAHYNDMWSRLSTLFKGVVTAYGLMNEPTGYSSTAQYEGVAQATVTYLRSINDNTLLMVGGYNFSGIPQSWSALHPVGFITDPAANFRYEGHHYWCRRATDYTIPYAAELGQNELRVPAHALRRGGRI